MEKMQINNELDNIDNNKPKKKICYNSVAIIWDNDNKIGYCNTFKEADDICKKSNNLSWSRTKNENKIKNLALLNINNYVTDKKKNNSRELINTLYKYDKNELKKLLNMLIKPVINNKQIDNNSCIKILCSNKNYYDIYFINCLEYSSSLSLKYVIIEEGISHISQSFVGCYNLKYVSIPKSVYLIDRITFCDCYNLETIYISINHPRLFIGIAAFKNCKSLININIPDNNNVTKNENNNIKYYDLSNTFAESMFEGCLKLNKIKIPSNIIFIGENVFKDCISLKNIIIPKNVKIITHNCFDNCYNLESVIIEDGLEEIGDEVFKGCSSLTSIIIPNTISWIGCDVFCKCINLKSITLPKSFENDIQNIIDVDKTFNIDKIKIIYT